MAAAADYRIEAITFSRVEQTVLDALQRSGPEAAVAAAERAGLLPRQGGRLKSNHERAELEEKFVQLGFAVPWSPG